MIKSMYQRTRSSKVLRYHLAWTWSGHHQLTDLLPGQMLMYKLGADRSPQQRNPWRPEYNSLLWEAKGWGGEWIVSLWAGCLAAALRGRCPPKWEQHSKIWVVVKAVACLIWHSHCFPPPFQTINLYLCYASILQMGFISRLMYWKMLTWG